MRHASLNGYQTLKSLKNLKNLNSIKSQVSFNTYKISLSNDKDVNDKLSISTEYFESETWLISQRYRNKEFLRIIGETDTEEQPTGGLKQFRSIKKLHKDLTLDTNQVCTYLFRKGSAKSIGASTVHTPIGEILLFIINFDLPLLLSLKGVDYRGIYFNNFQSIICTNDNESIGPHSLIRRFGHYFLFRGPNLNHL